MRYVYMIGDSIMHFNTIDAYPQFGWGQGLSLFKKEDVVVINLAENGTSTKSFINKGLFKNLIDNLIPDSYVIVSFGNNDEKLEDPLRGTIKDKDFLDNLEFMYQEIKKKNCSTVFATSPTRRKFQYGACIDSHKGYPQEMTKFCQEKGYTCIDLNQRTLDLYNKLGEDETKKFHLIFGPNEFKRFPDGVEDNSHLTLDGAIMISRIFLEELNKTESKLKEFFINE